MFYPYSQPIILTDEIFEAYGGSLDGTVDTVRNAAYQIAEQFVSEDIGTFLLPTTVTGTYAYSPVLILGHAWVNRIHVVNLYDVEERLYWSIQGTDNVYASLRKDGQYGQMDLHSVMANCQNCWPGFLPYKIEVAYTAGLSSGTSYQPNVLLGLTMMSRIVINEVIGFGNESTADVGVQRFSNQNYSETRVGLLRTVFGTSAQAQFIQKLLTPLKTYRYVGL